MQLKGRVPSNSKHIWDGFWRSVVEEDIYAPLSIILMQYSVSVNPLACSSVGVFLIGIGVHYWITVMLLGTFP